MTQYELITKVAKYGHKAFNLEGKNLCFFLTLLSYYNHETEKCYPSNESAEDGAGINPDNLHRHKKALKAAGVLLGYGFIPMGDGLKHSNYILNIPLIEERLAECESEAIQKREEYNRKHNVCPIEPQNAIEPFSEPEQVQDEPTYQEQERTPQGAIQEQLEPISDDTLTRFFKTLPGKPEPSQYNFNIYRNGITKWMPIANAFREWEAKQK
ncbi:TPA: hypothetical protein MJE56_25200 [Klebsiella pneumoniae]|nr:hypothetical protein [Klebsiella pneumoniae]HCB0861484.1 hypothetical protein [Klebsiella pneumoniae]